ncbi:MAG: ABC transporter substrate-binding protein [Desulfobacula sp.]|nr:ABC transporter substrate-binding protein [Desulfobacula sp.]
MKIFCVLFSVITTILLNSANPAFAQSVKPNIKIAAIFSKTGEAAAISEEHLIVTRFAVDEINAKGGILGRRIELIEIDNKSTALGSKQAALKAVEKSVVAVVGPSWSSHALAMADVLQQHGIPMVSPTATNPKVTQKGDFIFRACFIDSFQGEILAKFAYNELNLSSVAVLTNTGYVYSTDLAQRFINTFKTLKGNIAIELDYSEDLTDYSKLLKNLNTHKYDAVFIPGYTRDSAQIIKAARQMGVECPVLGGDGWSHLMFDYAPAKALNNTYYLTHWFKTVKDPKSLEFVKKIQHIFEDSKINAGMALSYDTVYLIAHAILNAQSFDPLKIKDALAATKNFKGVTGSVKFGPGRNPVKPAVILQFKDKKSQLVKQYLP